MFTMKTLRYTAAVALASISINAYAQPAISPNLSIGSSLPMTDVKMKATDNSQVTLGKAKTGKGLLVMFSCNTCPYVVKSQARTLEMMEYAKKNGLGMVIINSNAAKRDEDDSFDEMKQYAEAQGYSMPYVVDENSAIANAFGAMRTPEVFLFDGSGKLVYKGAMEDNPTDPASSQKIFLKTAIDNMLAKKTIDPSSTKSIGCTIKRM